MAETQDWKRQAVGAYAGRRTTAQRPTEEHRAELAREITERLGPDAELQFSESTDEAIVEGVTFRLGRWIGPAGVAGLAGGGHVTGGHSLLVVVRCPRCFQETEAGAGDWANIGQALAGEPFKHSCYADTPEGIYLAGLLAQEISAIVTGARRAEG